ncbi:MAG: DNA repair protein RadC [Pseudomonadota bacterium]
MACINELQSEDRPRERLLSLGASQLSDAELMAIFLRVGVAGMSAIELANVLLDRFGSLAEVFHAKAEEVCAVKGMGLAKFVQLQAIREMSKRVLASECKQRSILDCREAAHEYVRYHFASDNREVFRALWLDGGCGLIKSEILAEGMSTEVMISIRDIISKALLCKAAGLIIVHNHLSNSCEPSEADWVLTSNVRSALHWIGVSLHDHWIVTRHGVFPLETNSLVE